MVLVYLLNLKESARSAIYVLLLPVASLLPEMFAQLQADNRPVERRDPSPLANLQPGQANMPANQEAPSDHDEASNISTSERSESFTQALQKLQACQRFHSAHQSTGVKRKISLAPDQTARLKAHALLCLQAKSGGKPQ